MQRVPSQPDFGSHRAPVSQWQYFWCHWLPWPLACEVPSGRLRWQIENQMDFHGDAKLEEDISVGTLAGTAVN